MYFLDWFYLFFLQIYKEFYVMTIEPQKYIDQ